MPQRLLSPRTSLRKPSRRDWCIISSVLDLAKMTVDGRAVRPDRRLERTLAECDKVSDFYSAIRMQTALLIAVWS